jgi:hypothetical protein
MQIKGIHIILVCTLLAALGATSCKKTSTLTSGGIIKFSDDTLKFDTVFTAEGSFTTGILIYNPQSEAVTVSSVRMESGASSFFHLNVDGHTGATATNIRIAPHDSIYVFATVKINPNDTTNPFLIVDHLIATMNGKDFKMTFTAYGQNARYIIDSALTTTPVPWDNKLPYVIIWTGDTSKPHGLQINPGVTLTLNKGCRIYMHQNANITVFGTLKSNGTKTDSVVLQGDRLDRAYFGYIGYPGEWGGIYIDSKSSGSILKYTIFENCGNGSLGLAPSAIYVALDSINNPASPQLTLEDCTIRNSYGFGIYSFHGSVTATNCLINTTGQQSLAMVLGGKGLFTNCTFANYGTQAVSHSSSPTVAIQDYYWDGVSGDPVYYSSLNAVLRNCIVYGSLDSEITCDTTGSPAGTSVSLLLDHCLLKMGGVREPFVQFSACLFDDPLFKDATKGDFHLKSGSPAKTSATTTAPYTGADLDGVTTWYSSMGCYQTQ